MQEVNTEARSVGRALLAEDKDESDAREGLRNTINCDTEARRTWMKEVLLEELLKPVFQVFTMIYDEEG